VEVGDRDTLKLFQQFCIGGECVYECPSTDTNVVYVEVVEGPPTLAVLCEDTLAAEAGAQTVNVRFDVCNPGPCADTTCYAFSYEATSPVPELTGTGSGTLTAMEGDCRSVVVRLGATTAVPGDYALVRLAARAPCGAPAEVADTCSTYVRVVAPAELVPVAGTMVRALLVLALAVLGAWTLRRGAPVGRRIP
jgi:hypothetical protein